MSQFLSVLWIGLLLCVVGRIQSQDIHVPVEKQQQKTLECSFSSPVTSVTWKLLDVGNKEVILSTCTTTACTDQQPQNYTGRVAGSAGVYKATLNISSVSITETQFKCSADNGNVIASTILDVYVMPSTLSCRQSLVVNRYLDVICDIDNIYPSFSSELHRKESYSIQIDRNASSCGTGPTGSGSKGDKNGTCTYRIPFSSLLDRNTFYMTIFPLVWNDTIVNRPVVSREIISSFGLPNVGLNERDCPVVKHIKIGTTATCKCTLISSGLLSGKARWFTKNETVIGDEDPSGQFSILTLNYNASDPKPEYDCRAVNPSASYYHIVYKPKFTSSAHRSLFSGLTVVMAFCTVYMNLAFKLA